MLSHYSSFNTLILSCLRAGVRNSLGGLRAGGLILSEIPRPAVKPTQPAAHWVPTTGVKRRKCKTDRSRFQVQELRMCESLPPLSPVPSTQAQWQFCVMWE